MRMTVFQPVGVYPPPARNAWQLVHCATTISFPFPSGSSWLRAGNAEQKRTAATRDGSFDTLRVLQRVAVREVGARFHLVEARILRKLLRTQGEVQYGLHLEARSSCARISQSGKG